VAGRGRFQFSAHSLLPFGTEHTSACSFFDDRRGEKARRRLMKGSAHDVERLRNEMLRVGIRQPAVRTGHCCR
jgi:hypothetical protein